MTFFQLLSILYKIYNAFKGAIEAVSIKKKPDQQSDWKRDVFENAPQQKKEDK